MTNMQREGEAYCTYLQGEGYRKCIQLCLICRVRATGNATSTGSSLTSWSKAVTSPRKLKWFYDADFSRNLDFLEINIKFSNMVVILKITSDSWAKYVTR